LYAVCFTSNDYPIWFNFTILIECHKLNMAKINKCHAHFGGAVGQIEFILNETKTRSNELRSLDSPPIWMPCQAKTQNTKYKTENKAKTNRNKQQMAIHALNYLQSKCI